MKVLFIGAVLIITSAMWINALDDPQKANVMRAKIEERFKINEAHNDVLKELEAMENSYIKEFVSDWRSYYASGESTSYETLSELRKIKSVISDDPDSAKRFTVRHKLASSRKMNEVATPIFGGSFSDNIVPGM